MAQIAASAALVAAASVTASLQPLISAPTTQSVLIDYFFQWSSEAAAKADFLMLANFLNVTPGGLYSWASDKVLPNVQAWRPSQDAGGVHTYLTGWFAIVALPFQSQILLNATALAFALFRNGPPYVLRNNIGAVITDVAVSPIFAGSHYPIGGYT